MRLEKDRLKIFAGNSNIPLAQEINRYLGVSFGKAVVETFSDGETKVRLKSRKTSAV
jgi:ribose-phosphate pyrophosphokinase